MSVKEVLSQMDKASDKIVEANQLVLKAMSDYVFTWRWWIDLTMLILPWIVWGIFRKKDSSARLLYAGFFVIIFSALLDTIGVENGLWGYSFKVIPSPTINYSIRFSVMPVLVMLLIQVKPNINPYIKAIFFGGVGAYVGMPTMAMLDMYIKINWAYTYSFIILTGMYLLAHWVSRAKSFKSIEIYPEGISNVEINLDFFRRIKEKIK